MIEIYGKYNTAKVFTDNIEPSAGAQILELCNQPFTQGSRIRIMPDVHAGAGCTIGTTMTIKDKIVPNLVGVDIGCGMTVAFIEGGPPDFHNLDDYIGRYIPSGFSIYKHPLEIASSIDLSELDCKKYVELDKAYRSIGSLGGGNHFIEIDRNKAGVYCLVVHSGSRHLGLEVAKWYQNAAWELHKSASDINLHTASLMARYKGDKAKVKEAIEKYKAEHSELPPKSLAYLDDKLSHVQEKGSGSLFKSYIHDMKIVQRFAQINRQAMVNAICGHMGWKIIDTFTTIHNYVDTDNMILRKGAVSAQNGERLLIPVNMRDGSLLCIGKGNSDWNFSAPHGAGRLMSRSMANEKCNMNEYRKSMEGIYTTSVSYATLDECPEAYKPMEEIIANISDTADVVEHLHPVYNFKASDTGGRHRK